MCLSRWLSLVFLRTLSSRAKYKPSEILCVERLFSQAAEQRHVRQGTDECRIGPPALFDLSSLHICIVLPHFLMHSQPKNPPAQFILDPGPFGPLSVTASVLIHAKRDSCVSCVSSAFILISPRICLGVKVDLLLPRYLSLRKHHLHAAKPAYH